MVAGLKSTVFINEFHYDNVGTDTGEFIEIANTSGTKLDGWMIVLYSGATGKAYAKYALTGSSALTVVKLPVNGLQNDKDGMVLLNSDGKVVQFLSYEGAFTAKDGPAAGLDSTDVGVAESAKTPEGYSLQLYGSGTTYGDFAWAKENVATAGTANIEQKILVPTSTLIGDKSDDKLIGQDGSNDLLVGMKGNDVLMGLGGDDFILGNKGDDWLDGGTGNDTLYGGVGNDEIHGGEGDDRINGDKGDDKLFGDKGADTFVFNKAFGNDYIGDFEDGIDHIEFSVKVFKNFEQVKEAMWQDGSDVFIKTDKGDLLHIANISIDNLTADDFFFV